ncbi:hypothetical protein J4466_02930 [Candidatus Pacearchaeota archaeon]|nr:hypothetical protein [Candidatus Pacearchaeota archaeon]
MEVKEFVKTILKDVTEAIQESTRESTTHEFTMFSGENKKIEFDLAVILEKKEEGKVGAEIFKIVSGKLQGHLSEQVVNRIKFSVLPRLKQN